MLGFSTKTWEQLLTFCSVILRKEETNVWSYREISAHKSKPKPTAQQKGWTASWKGITRSKINTTHSAGGFLSDKGQDQNWSHQKYHELKSHSERGLVKGEATFMEACWRTRKRGNCAEREKRARAIAQQEELVLQEVEPGSIPSIPYGSLSTVRTDSWV